MIGRLILEDGSEFEGNCFGSNNSAAGEVVFATGMTGYPESLTDPSFKGQILIFTYPIIGSYGVPDRKYWESDAIQVSGLIVSNYINTPSHFQNKVNLGDWLKRENIPALEITDTRFLTQLIRAKGTMLGKIIINSEINFYDPNKENLLEKVSTKKITINGNGKKTILVIDCGLKRNIQRILIKKGIRVITVPWNFDPFAKKIKKFNAIVVTNGPGDPKMADKTITIIKKAMKEEIPILGICLGHQLLALAAGGNTRKLKYGHRSQNQPCALTGTNRCFITTQNHGFYVSDIPAGFRSWFTNANDQTNEGLMHKKLPFMSVQFHPEADPGPTDTGWIFDYFLEKI